MSAEHDNHGMSVANWTGVGVIILGSVIMSLAVIQDARPLFIVGLPRSGTTLVDRIVSSHSGVSSRGETSDLAMALMHCAGPPPCRTDRRPRGLLHTPTPAAWR